MYLVTNTAHSLQIGSAGQHGRVFHLGEYFQQFYAVPSFVLQVQLQQHVQLFGHVAAERGVEVGRQPFGDNVLHRFGQSDVHLVHAERIAQQRTRVARRSSQPERRPTAVMDDTNELRRGDWREENNDRPPEQQTIIARTTDVQRTWPHVASIV